jgi:hypothetical protein
MRHAGAKRTAAMSQREWEDRLAIRIFAGQWHAEQSGPSKIYGKYLLTIKTAKRFGAAEHPVD